MKSRPSLAKIKEALDLAGVVPSVSDWMETIEIVSRLHGNSINSNTVANSESYVACHKYFALGVRATGVNVNIPEWVEEMISDELADLSKDAVAI